MDYDTTKLITSFFLLIPSKAKETKHHNRNSNSNWASVSLCANYLRAETQTLI